MSFCLTPSLNQLDAKKQLARLIRPEVNPELFQVSIDHLHRLYSAFVANSPPPWPAAGLAVTPEIGYQSELWLPLNQIRPTFYQLYRHSLTYPPIVSSTPFATASSWASVVGSFPAFLQMHSNPARLLEQLVRDHELRKLFLFWSFMPARFYGGLKDSYPGQSAFIREALSRRQGRVCCLDAACGDGAATYRLTRLLLEQGCEPKNLWVEGWTIDPLEVWSAAYGKVPHDPEREAFLQQELVGLAPAANRIIFRSGDLLRPFCTTGQLDLIICNGILGGPIINSTDDQRRVVQNLVSMLNPQGLIVCADRFHGGWKEKCPQGQLRALLVEQGLEVVNAGEGLAGFQRQQ